MVWDLRVAPGRRGQGIGTALFAAVEEWARARGQTSLLAETQHTNVAACRLYERCGCDLEHFDAAAYPAFPDEIQLIWRKRLARPAHRS